MGLGVINWRYPDVVTTAQAARRMSVTEAVFLRAARRAAERPCCIIDGESYWEPDSRARIRAAIAQEPPSSGSRG